MQNILQVFNFASSVKIINKSLTEYQFFIANQCNYHQICYKNSNFITVQICDVWVSISYFNQILGKRESQTQHVLILQFCGFETFHRYKILQKWSKITKFNTHTNK